MAESIGLESIPDICRITLHWDLREEWYDFEVMFDVFLVNTAVVMYVTKMNHGQSHHHLVRCCCARSEQKKSR